MKVEYCSVVYPGTFDPFTNGHLSIVKKASKLFDKVYIVVARNPNKKRVFDERWMRIGIERVILSENLDNCIVKEYDGLIAEFAKENKLQYIVRGLRNNIDYSYEENIADANKLINPNLEYVYLRADDRAISSTMVRELIFAKTDVSEFVPEPMLAPLSRALLKITQNTQNPQDLEKKKRIFGKGDRV